MLSEEKEEEIWEKARKFWFYARLPKPIIIQDPEVDDSAAKTPEAKISLHDEHGAPEFITYTDNQTYLNMKNILKDLGIKTEQELENAVEALELHGIGHYSLIPYDLLTKLILVHNSAKALKSQGVADGAQAQMVGANVENVFEDIVDNTYLIEHGEEKGYPENKENICFLYDRFNKGKEEDPEKKDLPRKTWDVYMRVCEKFWDEDGRWVKKKKFSSDQEKAAERIYTLMKDDMYNIRGWDRRVFRFAQILAPFIKEDGQQAKDLQMFEQDSSGQGKRLKQMLQDLKDMRDKQQQQGQGKGDKEEKDLEKKIKDGQRKVEEQLEGLANKLDKGGNNRNLIQDYKELTIGSGVLDSEETANKWLYRDLARNYSVKFQPIRTTMGKEHPFTPMTWNPSDPPRTLDLQYTLQTQGVVIPSVTTKKWKYRETIGFKEGERPPDLYLMLDSSGSMINPKNQIAPAILAAIAAAHSARNVGAKVAVKNFSGDTDTLEETEDEDDIDDTLLVFKGGGTDLPTEDLIPWVKNPEIPKQFLLITDTGFNNFDSSFPYLEEIMKMNPKNRGAIFCIGHAIPEYVQRLENIGYEVFYVKSQDDLFDVVIGKAKEVYEGMDDEVYEI